DVRAVVAVKRRLHPDRLAAGAEQSGDDPSSLLDVTLPGRVEVLAEVAGPVAGEDQLGVERVVQFAGQHLLAFAAHWLPSVGRPRPIAGKGRTAAGSLLDPTEDDEDPRFGAEGLED